MAPHAIQMVGLYVKSFDAAVTFYRDVVGIPLEVDAHGDYHHADYSFREPYFHFAIFPAMPDQLVSGMAHLSIRVDDCKEAFRRALAAGASSRKEPTPVSYSGGGLSAEVLDPDGNEVEFFQPDSN